MRLLPALLLLITTIAKSQCPDADSILKARGPINFPPSIWPPGYPPPPYIINVSSGTWAFTSYKPTLNDEPQQGKKVYFKNGWCYIYHPESAALLAKGKVINKKKTGKWYWYTYDQTLQATGEYVNGLKQGTWKIFNGEEAYSIGKYINGYREGDWKTINSIHTLQTKEFYKNGYKEGKCTNYRYDGKLESVYYYGNEMKNQTTMLYDEQGRLTEKSYTYNWKLYGERVFYEYDEARKTIEHYRNGELNGWKIIYQYNKLLSKEYYKGYWRNGPSIVYDGDRKYVRNYKMDQLDGVCKMYVKQNNKWVLKNESHWKLNVLEGPELSILNDSTTMYTKHKNGQKNGLCYTLLRLKDTISVCNYIMEKKHGREMEINNGRKKECYYHYNTITQQTVWNNGVLYERLKFINHQTIDMAHTVPTENNQLIETLFHPNKTIKSTKTFKENAKFNDTIVVNEYYDNGKLRRQYTLINHQYEGLFVGLNELGDTLQFLHKHLSKNEGYGIVFNNKFVEKGNFVNDMKEGEWNFYYANSNGTNTQQLAAQGRMIAGEPFETWKMYYESDAASKGDERRLQFEGCKCGNAPAYNFSIPWIPLTDRSNLYITPATIGVDCGDRTIYYHNRNVKEVLKKNNYTSYYSTGQLWETGVYVNGLKEGIWLKYHIDGSLLEEKKYERGIVIPVN